MCSIGNPFGAWDVLEVFCNLISHKNFHTKTWNCPSGGMNESNFSTFHRFNLIQGWKWTSVKTFGFIHDKRKSGLPDSFTLESILPFTDDKTVEPWRSSNRLSWKLVLHDNEKSIVNVSYTGVGTMLQRFSKDILFSRTNSKETCRVNL